MRRIILLVTVALVMAVMLLANAFPAFAAGPGTAGPQTGDCAQRVAQGEHESTGGLNNGELIRFFCIEDKPL